jgi:hypothetical protein
VSRSAPRHIRSSLFAQPWLRLGTTLRNTGKRQGGSLMAVVLLRQIDSG